MKPPAMGDHPGGTGRLRGATADDEFGGRAEINANVLEDLYRREVLEADGSAAHERGPVFNPAIIAFLTGPFWNGMEWNGMDGQWNGWNGMEWNGQWNGRMEWK